MPEMRTAPDGVTILMTNWNHEYLLPRSVGSALRTVRDLRQHGVAADVLVVDDGSRDGSMTLLRQLEALHFEDGLRVLALPKNGGHVGIARNAGLPHAHYRYAVFFDSDDELIPENMIYFYRSIVQTGAALVYGSMIGVGDDEESYTLISNESYQPRILQQNYIGALVLTDRMQLADLGGYTENPAMFAREDWELHLHLAANGRRLVFVPLVMGIYYDVPNSMTKDADQSALHQKQHAYIRRSFNQLGIRQRQLLNTRHLRYHPDIGYL